MNNINFFLKIYHFMLSMANDGYTRSNKVIGQVTVSDVIYEITSNKSQSAITLCFSSYNLPINFILEYCNNKTLEIFSIDNSDFNMTITKDFLNTLTTDYETMDDVEFVLAHGRDPLKINSYIHQILETACEEGIFDI